LKYRSYIFCFYSSIIACYNTRVFIVVPVFDILAMCQNDTTVSDDNDQVSTRDKRFHRAFSRSTKTISAIVVTIVVAAQFIVFEPRCAKTVR